LESMPEFQKFLSLANQGRKIEVSEAKDEPEDAGSTSFDEILKDLSPEENEEAADAVAEKKKMLEGFKSVVASQVKPLTDKIGILEEQIVQNNRATQDANILSEMQQVAKQFNDFPDYKDDMIKKEKEIRERGGFSIKDLYSLAKVDKIGLPKPGDETEKPSELLTSEGIKPMNDKVRLGASGFEDMINEVLNK